MGRSEAHAPSVPRIERLHVRNYRTLRDLTLAEITPLTVLLGPNGSGKSTVFDVFAFLSECFSVGLRKAWDGRGRFRELRTRETEGPIVIELAYRESEILPPIVYHLTLDEDGKVPCVAEEWMEWRPDGGGEPFRFLSFSRGVGEVAEGDDPRVRGARTRETLDAPDMLGVNTLGQLARHPRVSALRRFITGWHLSRLTAENTRAIPAAGPQERLSSGGENLPNVIQYLKEEDPERLKKILEVLTRRIPRLEKVEAETLLDGRILLQIKDAPFQRPILSRFTSDGTLKMLAYLTLLYDPRPPQLIGIEEPENHLHPRLLQELAEECRAAAEVAQIMVTTHSPFFVSALRPEEVRVLFRDIEGYTQARRASELKGVQSFMEAGANLGHLWMEGYFGVGDPLENGGNEAAAP
ncbi:MAG: AAA family ATPase [Planctomycetota bacterium]